MKKILLLLVVALSFSACEKDDICVDETTPMLVLEFYDISNPTVTKNVVGLKIKATDLTTVLGTYSGVSKIKLPLKTTADITKYSLILNSTSTTNFNEDDLEFDYTRQNVFVSRACGYKTIFALNNPNGVILTDAPVPDGYWIQSINVQTYSITTQNETHIKIYF
jgi:hypothetical protein